MCGILTIGFVDGHKLQNKRKEVINFIKELFKETQLRGRVSTGVALSSEKEIVFMKDKLPGGAFVDSEDFHDFLNDHLNLNAEDAQRTYSLIGHCRLDTKGSPFVNVNNHPIHCGKIVGVHNGCIGNDDELFETYKSDFKRLGEVDSEIIFQLLNHYYKDNVKKTANLSVRPMKDAIISTMGELTGGAACIALNSQEPENIFMFKSSNPLDLHYYKKLGMLVACSSRAFINTAFNRAFPADSCTFKSIELAGQSGIIVDVANNQYHTFSINTQRFVTY